MKLGDLRRKLRGLEAPTCDCPDAASGEHYNECSPDQPWKRRRVATDPGGRPLDFKSKVAERVIGLDVGMSGDRTAMVTGSRGEDGTITIDSISSVPKGTKEIPFTGVHRLIHEPDDMSERRICKAVNAVPGAVLSDHRFCATGVRKLGRSLGDRYLEAHAGDHRAWITLATSFVNLDGRFSELSKEHFVACPSDSDPPTLVKYVAARDATASGPDEPMRRMFAVVAAEAKLDVDGTPRPVRLHRCSAFALYPAEVRVCWTCGGSRIVKTLARVSEDEPEWAACTRCRGLGVLWDHRPHHAEPRDIADARLLRFADARLLRFEDAPPPSRLER